MLVGSFRTLANGRPRIPSKEDLLDFTFAVPNSPMRGPHSRKKFSSQDCIELSKSEDDEEGLPRELDQVIFPDATKEKARHQVDKETLEPWSYLLSIPGKNVRDRLIDAFNKWIGVKDEDLTLIKQIVGYLHSASLIVDDIEDESDTRRGFDAAHIKFGQALSLNAANYVYFLALEKVLQLQSPRAVEVFTAEMLNLHRGQGRDILWRERSRVVSDEEYLRMIKDKTGGLFRLAISLLVAASGNKMEESRLSLILEISDNLACFFQIRDDLINLASPEFHQKKGFCEDITEGKFSFIALHTLRNSPHAKELVEILKSGTKDRKQICRALKIMNESESFEFVMEYLENLKIQISEGIHVLDGGNEDLEVILKALAKDLDDCYDIEVRVIDAN